MREKTFFQCQFIFEIVFKTNAPKHMFAWKSDAKVFAELLRQPGIDQQLAKAQIAPRHFHLLGMHLVEMHAQFVAIE